MNYKPNFNFSRVVPVHPQYQEEQEHRAQQVAQRLEDSNNLMQDIKHQAVSLLIE